jgi:integrase
VEWRLSLDKHAGRHVESKAEAIALADQLRIDIRAGRGPGQVKAPEAVVGLTFGDVCDSYLKRFVNVPTRRKRAKREMQNHVAELCASLVPAANGALMALGSKPLAAITRADVEAIRERKRQKSAEAIVMLEARRTAPEAAPLVLPARPGCKQGEVGLNRLLARLRHVFSWAIDEGHIDGTPFLRNGRPAVRLNHDAEAARTRRLQDGEEARLLAAAGPHLKDVLEGLLETGCRVGELLALQWCDYAPDAGVIVIPATVAKTGESRAVPVTARLKAILEYRRIGPDGKELKVEAYVFGDETGGRIRSVRTAFRATCRRAGIVGLHLHDLRRECGSRLIECGVNLHEVADWLGHRQVTTTNVYLRTTLRRMQDAARKYDQARIRTPLPQTDGSTEAAGNKTAHAEPVRSSTVN